MLSMSSLLLLAISSVFVFAAVAKLLNPAGTWSTLGAFGVPESLRSKLALALPSGEIVLASALLSPPLGRAAAACAAGVLAFFAAVLAYNVVRGRAPSCSCFGQAAARPIGWHTVARNCVLATGAGLAAWGPSAGAMERVQVPVPIGSIAAVAAVALAACYATARQEQIRLLGRLQAIESRRPSASDPAAEGLPVGSPAPGFELPGVDGQVRNLGHLVSGARPVVLLFTDLKCKPCNELLPLVAEWQSAGAGRVNFAVVSRGSVEDNADKAAKYGVHNYLVQNSVEVIRAYAVTAAPSAVIVRSDGSIGSPVVVGSPQIIELVSTLIGTLEVLDSTKRHPAGVA